MRAKLMSDAALIATTHHMVALRRTLCQHCIVLFNIVLLGKEIYLCLLPLMECGFVQWINIYSLQEK